MFRKRKSHKEMHFNLTRDFLILFTFLCKENKLDNKPTLVFVKAKGTEPSICSQTVAKMAFKFLKRKCEKGVSKKKATSGKSFMKNQTIICGNSN